VTKCGNKLTPALVVVCRGSTVWYEKHFVLIIISF